MSKIKLTEEDRNKMTDLEMTTYDNQINFCSMTMLLTVIGVPFVGILNIAHFIWSSKLTLFLALSSSLLEVLLVILLVTSLVGLSNNIKKLKEKVSTR